MKSLAEWKDKDIKTSDVESVKKAISDARNAAMKIGQAMYNQQSGQSSGDQNQQNQNQNQGENQEGGEKKQWWFINVKYFFYPALF